MAQISPKTTYYSVILIIFEGNLNAKKVIRKKSGGKILLFCAFMVCTGSHSVKFMPLNNYVDGKLNTYEFIAVRMLIVAVSNKNGVLRSF